MSSVKSDIWLILRWWKSIFVGSLNWHFHPSLFLGKAAFAAGYAGEDHVKIWGHSYLYFSVCTKGLVITGLVHTTRQIEREDRFCRWVSLYGSTEQIRRAIHLSFDGHAATAHSIVFIDEQP
jgi:hypothetical protein